MPPRWSGTVACLAGGESVSDLELAPLAGVPVIAIKEAAELWPGAEILYAADATWWDYACGAPGFAGEKWSCTQNERPPADAAHGGRWGLKVIRSKVGAGISTDPGFIWQGFHAGFQALGLAVLGLGGAGRVLLIGYDCRGGRFFGTRPGRPSRAHQHETWIAAYLAVARRLGEIGVEVINCSPRSAIDAFPRRTLAEAIRP